MVTISKSDDTLPWFLLIATTIVLIMMMMIRQPKSSQLELKVHANPRNLNASTMAAILNNDSALTDHANNHLGINIKGFEAGSKVRIHLKIVNGA